MPKWKALLRLSLPLIRMAVKDRLKKNSMKSDLTNFGLDYLQQLNENLIAGDAEKLIQHLDKTTKDVE